MNIYIIQRWNIPNIECSTNITLPSRDAIYYLLTPTTPRGAWAAHQQDAIYKII